MSRIRFVRYGIASALVAAAASMSASCVSGTIDSSGVGNVDPGAAGQQQGNAATGNSPTGGSGTGNVANGGSGNGLAGANSTGGSAPVDNTAGSGASGGGTPPGQGGSTSTTAGTGGGSGSGNGGSGAVAGKGGSTGMAGTGNMAGSTGMGMAGTGAAGGPSGPQPPPAITGATSGFATRYWDCCKPACSNNKVSCSGGTSTDGGNNGSACTGGNSYMCYNFEPFQDSANKYISYAFAASHRACGSCWELQFTGASGCSEGSSCPGTATALLYNTLYVQVLNTGDIKDDQFDLLVPGGGVGQYNACSKEWGTSDLGATYGGFLTGCNGSVSCTQTKCNTVFAGKPDLLAGCNWFLGWYGASDNPQIKFKQVSCPSQLTSKSGMSG